MLCNLSTFVYSNVPWLSKQLNMKNCMSDAQRDAVLNYLEIEIDSKWKVFFFLNCHIGCDFKLNACHIFIVFEIENEIICKIKGLLLMIWNPRIIHVMSWKLLDTSVLTTPGCSDDTMTFVSFNRRFIKYICITW